MAGAKYYWEVYIYGRFPKQQCRLSGCSSGQAAPAFITRTYTHLVGGHPRIHPGRVWLCSNPALAGQIAQFHARLQLVSDSRRLHADRLGWPRALRKPSSSIGMQYFAYGAYVVAEALIFRASPVHRRPQRLPARSTKRHAGHGKWARVDSCSSAHRTRKDFSFLRARY